MGRVVSALPIISFDHVSGFEACGKGKTVEVTRDLTLHLDEFLRGALDGYARERHDSPSSIVRMAALYWLADRDSGRTAWRAPRFRRDAGLSGESMRVGVDDETWQALEEEALRQGVDAELLAEHALLYFLADLDSGRVGSRLQHLSDPEA
jgi:predicted transcriptional regulator